MNHVMVEYLAQSLSEGWNNEKNSKNRLMAHEQRTAKRAGRRRRWSRS
jgi:hypothetical protein